MPHGEKAQQAKQQRVTAKVRPGGLSDRGIGASGRTQTDSAAGRDTVPAANSAEAFVALRRLDKTVEYALYARGDHGSSSFDRVDALDFFARMIAWFNTYLTTPNG